LGRGLRGREPKNKAVEELKRAEEKEEIVCMKYLKGGCDVFE